MSTLERGFKTWCERRAASLREEMKLSEDAPLDVFDAAKHMHVKVIEPADVAGMAPEDLRQLLKQDAGGWSAVTIELSQVSVVVLNPAHSKGRIASDLAHELAHILLKHTGSLHYFSADESGMMLRTYDTKREEEANWLGWALLLPRIALVRAREERTSIADIATRFGVSEALAKFRLQKTGVDVQLARRRRS